MQNHQAPVKSHSRKLRSGRATARFDAELVIDGMYDSLTRTEIPLRGLNRAVPEQELDLFQLAASRVTEPERKCAGDREVRACRCRPALRAPGLPTTPPSH